MDRALLPPVLKGHNSIFRAGKTVWHKTDEAVTSMHNKSVYRYQYLPQNIGIVVHRETFWIERHNPLPKLPARRDGNNAPPYSFAILHSAFWMSRGRHFFTQVLYAKRSSLWMPAGATFVDHEMSTLVPLSSIPHLLLQPSSPPILWFHHRQLASLENSNDRWLVTTKYRGVAVQLVTTIRRQRNKLGIGA